MWSPFKKKPAKRRKAAPKRRRNPARTMSLYRVRQHHFRASSAVHAKAAYLRELGYSARVDGRKLVTNAPRSAFVGVEAYRQTRANPAKRRRAAPARRRRRARR